MSVLEIVLYAVIGGATLIYCIVIITKAIKKRKGKTKNEDENE